MMNKIMILFIFLTLLTACVDKQAEKSADQQEPVIANQKVERELLELNLSGSGYELGMQHGKQLKNEIEEIVKKWKKNTSQRLDRNSEDVLNEFMEYAQFSEAIKKWTPDLYEEVRGIADGSEQNFDDILVLNLLDEFWVYLNNPSNHHCSNIGAPSFNGGQTYVAQNMDIEEYTDGYQTLIRIERSDSYPEQLILTHPGLIALNGMNEKSVGVCVNTIMQLEASATGLPVAFVVRRIINSTDKEELIEFITSVEHASGQSYIIGIGEEVFNFEASANEVVRFNPGNKNGSVYHTNHPIVNSDVKEWFKQFNPESLDIQLPNTSNSYIRLKSLEKRIAENESIDDKIIMESLRSKDDKNNPVCRNNTFTNRGFTFASIIMTLTGNPNLQMTVGPPDESEYQRFDFSN